MATASTVERIRVPSTSAPRARVRRAVVEEPAPRPLPAPRWEGPDYSEFTSRFNDVQRQELLDDDLFAGTSVAIVLTTVIALGLLAMAGTVLLTLL